MKEVTLAERVRMIEEYIKERDAVTPVETKNGVKFVAKSPGNCKRIGNCPDGFCSHKAWCVDCPAWEYREPKAVEGNSNKNKEACHVYYYKGRNDRGNQKTPA